MTATHQHCKANNQTGFWPGLEYDFQVLKTGRFDSIERTTVDYATSFNRVSNSLCKLGTVILWKLGVLSPNVTAEDVTHNWFLRMHGSGFENCDIDLPIHPFARVVFDGLCLNCQRAQYRRRLVFTESLGNVECQGERPKDIDAVVRQAVDCLPPNYRDAVVSRYFEKRSSNETAAQYGVQAGTVNSWRNRALKELAKLIKDVI